MAGISGPGNAAIDYCRISIEGQAKINPIVLE
jgi:hypothetical protein